MKYLHTLRDRASGLVLSERSSFPEFAKCKYTHLKTYEVKDDGSLVEYVKPERSFAYEGVEGFIGKAQPQSHWNFHYKRAVKWYEVMPDTGDYRRISEKERARLEAEV